MPLSIIFSDFQPVLLSNKISQDDSLEYLSRVFKQVQAQDSASGHKNIEAYIRKYAVGSNHIGQREINAIPSNLKKVLASHKTIDPPLPYLPNPVSQPRGSLLDKRMGLYEELCQQAIDQLYLTESNPPSDLIHVSCSGYTAPSVAEKLVASKGWPTTVTHSYHMGCYGAFPAIRIAAGLLSTAQAVFNQPKPRVDIAHTEYLTLHLNSAELSANNLINATLFGDGFIKYSAYTDDFFVKEKKRGLKLLAISEVLLPDSSNEMTWNPSSHQFEMFLSRYVPIHIRQHIKPFIVKLCAQAGIDFDREKNELYFGIHPGGPGILNHIQKQLDIHDDQMDLSWEVLKHNGNMSSVTVPYIWKSILEEKRFDKGQKVVSMAFGPGLTASGSVMEIV